MEIKMMIEMLPLWLFYLLTVAIVFASVMTGFRIGGNLRLRNKGLSEAPIGTIVGAMLGLLAFILAFTFGMAATRFDARKNLLLDETNAIGTAFLRADFLPAIQRQNTKTMLKKYVDIRIAGVSNRAKLPQMLAESDTLQDQLWAQVTGLPEQSCNAELLALYVQSLNEVIDIHAKRVTVGTQYRIPGSIWMALYFVTILTMGMVGYDFGVSNRGVLMISLALALAFSSIILLIEDLDRPTEGFLKVSQRPMIELQQKLHKSDK